MRLRAALLWLVGSLWLAMWSIARYNAGLATSYDLGIFSQSAKSWSQGHWPRSDIRGLDLLGDHFSPVLALNGLWWRIWSDPRVLLLVQAILIALAMVIVWWVARTLVGEPIALALFAVGLIARGTIAADLFDFHEVAYAAPTVALLAAAAVRGRFRLAVGAAIVLVLVKEDLGLTVIAAAATWWLLHRDGWRRPAVLAGVGVAGLVAATVVLRVVGGGSGYGVFFGGSGSTPMGQQVDTGWSWWRLAPLALFAVTALFVGLRSPVAVLAIPTLAWRMIGNNPSYWRLDTHYDLILVPIALIAAAHAMSRLPSAHFWNAFHPQRDISGESRSKSPVVASAAVLGGVISVGLGGSQLVEVAAAPWHAVAPTQRFRDLQEISARIPKDAPIAASNTTGAYLVATHDQVWSIESAPAVRYVVFGRDGGPLDEVSGCQGDALLDDAKGLGGATAQGDIIAIRYLEPTVVRLADCDEAGSDR
ncbi:DUF2079 domain-containing protein [Branchiibius sp. NY16-3462-2]|uniref:DUF2079 domain-containing protein n=1 Tax=Branchiibius sp. NY16-3462-2 TaxID=1807500 RepID=UPI000791EC36|nr:DUF2079 domain-containing protein [Branchiibius sp. NY16-3462-2]KYH45659.1 hypothetical protein AZH51_18275 [Branchiibius sp. NY16-3462-2]